MGKRDKSGSPIDSLLLHRKGKSGVERVKRAKKRYNRRMQGGCRGRRKYYLIPVALLCICLIAMVAGRRMDKRRIQEEAAPPEEVSGTVRAARSVRIIPTVRTSQREEDTGLFLDVFEVTGYCSCDKCCGDKEIKLTKSGTVPRSSYTVAADPKVLPLGSRIMIDGVLYVVEDTGKAVKGKVIDIYFDTHEEAVEFGRQQKDVYLIK